MLIVVLSVLLFAVSAFSQTPQTSSRDTYPKVEIFVTSWCPYCRKAEQFFRQRNIPYTVYDIEKDPQAAARKNRLDPQQGVPLTLINGYPIHGFSAKFYAMVLDDPSFSR